MTDLAAAPDFEAIQQKTSGSSFYSAMRLMPKAERDAMFAIYAFCRAVDDIADEGIGTRTEREAALDAWRTDLAALYAGRPSPRGDFLRDAVKRYGLRQEDFRAVIDGMSMDVVQDIRGPSLETLDLYCDRVASAVGRLSIKVFGMDEEPGFPLAFHLGRALQLTNILRDLDEDAGMGRLYLPREYLDESCIAPDNPAAAIAQPGIDAVCRKVAMLAQAQYEKARAIMRTRPKGRMQTPRLMAAVYSGILGEMERAGWAPPRLRVSLGKARLLRIVIASSLFG